MNGNAESIPSEAADGVNDGDFDSIPETKVLAIASHVVYGYVGNTMATLVLQAMGLETAAINTVHFSNHTGYGQFRGSRTPAAEIKALYEGLKQSYLTDFDVLLTGYTPSAEALHEVALIARDLRYRATHRPGSFFWVLDPVMGDQGRLYVSEELVKGYKEVVREADLILPNQFEVEVLTGVKIGTENEGAKIEDVARAIDILHREYGVPHVVVTSVHVQGKSGKLCVVGSSARKNNHHHHYKSGANGDGAGDSSSSSSPSRIFAIDVPVLDCYFSGTGDMFAALMVGRLRQACRDAGVLDTTAWTSPDDVPSDQLPLARATCKVLSSMQTILEKTMVARNRELDAHRQKHPDHNGGGGGDNDDDDGSIGAHVGDKEERVVHTKVDADGPGGNDDPSKRESLFKTKAAEVRVVRNVADLISPRERYQPTALELSLDR